MTQAQEQAERRLTEIRKQKRATFGLGPMMGTPDGDIMADQGPTQAGGIVGQTAAPGFLERLARGGGSAPSGSGRLPGKNRFAIGNPKNGTIDLGTFMSARVDPAAQTALNADPLADVQRYKPAGFFRTLLGDDANERNERDAANRGQLLTQKWLLDQDVSGKRALFNEQQAARIAQDTANREHDIKLADQGFQNQMSVARFNEHGRVAERNDRSVEDLLKDTRNNLFTAQQNAAQRGTIERGQDLTADWRGMQTENQLLRTLAGGEGSGGLNGFKVPVGMGYDPVSGNYTSWDPTEGKLMQIPRSGGAPNMGAQSPGNLNPYSTTKPAPPTPEVLDALRSEFGKMEADQAAAPVDVSQPSTAMGGLRAVGRDLFGGYTGAMDKIAEYHPLGIATRNLGGAAAETLKSYADQDVMERRLEQLRNKLRQRKMETRTFEDTIPRY